MRNEKDEGSLGRVAYWDDSTQASLPRFLSAASIAPCIISFSFNNYTPGTGDVESLEWVIWNVVHS